MCVIRFDEVHERDGETDGQNDTALCIASRGKNGSLLEITVASLVYIEVKE